MSSPDATPGNTPVLLSADLLTKDRDGLSFSESAIHEREAAYTRFTERLSDEIEAEVKRFKVDTVSKTHVETAYQRLVMPTPENKMRLMYSSLGAGSMTAGVIAIIIQFFILEEIPWPLILLLLAFIAALAVSALNLGRSIQGH